MKRHVIEPRPDWVKQVESFGMIYHHNPDGSVYWNESAYYELTAEEVETIEVATAELARICLEAVAHVIHKGRWAELSIPPTAIPAIVRSWNEDHPSVYGRFDLALTDGVPKLLEFNADTPTMLLEAAVIQWQWLAARFPKADQFNSIHEKLLAWWKELKESDEIPPLVYFAHLEHIEDLMTVTYLRDTAEQAGLKTAGLLMKEISWDGVCFVDPLGAPIDTLFKLYPWEDLWREPFGNFVGVAPTHWLEPAWKMLLSNKAILPVLWELYPGHLNLLPTYFHTQQNLKSWVCKPAFGREGNNLKMRLPGGAEIETAGEYGSERPLVYQQYSQLPTFEHGPDVLHALIGSWLIGGEPAGIGIRESDTPITRNESPFVPHLFREA